jgi:hypothetical protein
VKMAHIRQSRPGSGLGFREGWWDRPVHRNDAVLEAELGESEI